MKHTMLLQKNEARYAPTKNMKSIKELQTNEAHYANANERSILCNCKQMKQIR